MIFKYFVMILIQILLLHKIKCELIFEDDFNELNSTNWIFLDRKADCERLNPRQMACDTSNEINLRSINSTLTITAIIQSYFDRKFTSATIVTKRTFKFDGYNYLIRIRAALPKEPGLQPHIFLIIDSEYNRREFSSFFTIMRRTYSKIWNGNNLDQMDKMPLNNTNFDAFQNFDLIITKEMEFIWRINNHDYFNADRRDQISQSIKLLDQPFRLGITLDLDSDFTERQLDQLSFNQWKCPTLMIDYVKVFKSKQLDFELLDDKLNIEEKNILDICKSISSLEYDSKITPGLIKPLQLLWSDEFDDNSIQKSNWIIKNSHIKCTDNNRVEVKDCNFNENSNIEISNGTLKLYPIDRELNEPGENSSLHTIGLVIASIQYFKNVRVEIRAKRPKGQELTAKLYMQAYHGPFNSDIVKGTIDIAKIRDTDESFWGLQTRDQISVYNRDMFKKQFQVGITAPFYRQKFFVSSINLTSNLKHLNNHCTSDKLDDFQNYGIEWNDFGIQWLFNNRVIYQANQKLDQYGRFMSQHDVNNDGFYLPFDQPFNILIKILAHEHEIDEDTEPPVFEIDYVRVYGNQLIGSEFFDFTDLDKQFEQNITEVIDEKDPPYLLIGASSLVLIVLIILVIALVFALLKIKNINKTKDNKIKDIDLIYDDTINEENHIYDDITYYHLYAEPIYDNNSNENVYCNLNYNPYENSPDNEKYRKCQYVNMS